MSGISVSASFARNSGGTVGVVCPAANCNFASAPGFDAGDTLLWTEDSNGNGTGPLALSFAVPVRGVGFYFQVTAPANFTALFFTNPGREIVASDSAGDPIFLGALDPQADITGIEVFGLACAPLSPGGCSPSDFAIDSVSLTTVPEPRTVVSIIVAAIVLTFRLTSRRGRRAQDRLQLLRGRPVLLCALFFTPAATSLRGQDPVPIPPDEAPPIHINNANPLLSMDPPALLELDASTASLPIWRYESSSPVTGFTYGGYMVGTSPFNRGARSTTIPVILVPFVISFQNTSTGFSATFDPSSAPDAGCTAGQTVMSLVEISPLFQAQDWTLNGVYLGNTQYIDAYQRANFWQYVQNTGDAYHLLLNYNHSIGRHNLRLRSPCGRDQSKGTGAQQR